MKQVTDNPYAGPETDQVPLRTKENTAAKLGFALSVLGWVALLTLSTAQFAALLWFCGLIVSGFGFQQRPRLLASCGMLLGILGLLMIV